MWERGLKHSVTTVQIVEIIVAPHVGAWIETEKKADPCTMNDWSLPMWERGLKRNLLRNF